MFFRTKSLDKRQSRQQGIDYAAESRGLARHFEVVEAHLFRHFNTTKANCQHELGELFRAYNKNIEHHTHDYVRHVRECERARNNAAGLHENNEPPHRRCLPLYLPLSPKMYVASQIGVALIDLAMSFESFQALGFLFFIAFPLAIAVGLIGVIVGHFLGKSIEHGDKRGRTVYGGIAVVYCGMIAYARMRFFNKSSQGVMDWSNPSFTVTSDVISGGFMSAAIVAFFMFISTLLATQYVPPSSKDKAEAMLRSVEKRRDGIFKAGYSIEKEFLEKYNNHVHETRSHYDAYCDGFLESWGDAQVEIPPWNFDARHQAVTWPRDEGTIARVRAEQEGIIRGHAPPADSPSSHETRSESSGKGSDPDKHVRSTIERQPAREGEPL